MAAIVLSNREAKKLGLSVESELRKSLTLVQVGYEEGEEPRKFFLSTLANEVLVVTREFTRYSTDNEISRTMYSGKELYEYLKTDEKSDKCIIQNDYSISDLYFTVDTFGMITLWTAAGVIIWTSEMDTDLFETPFNETTVYNKLLELYGISDL